MNPERAMATTQEVITIRVDELGSHMDREIPDMGGPSTRVHVNLPRTRLIGHGQANDTPLRQPLTFNNNNVCYLEPNFSRSLLGYLLIAFLNRHH